MKFINICVWLLVKIIMTNNIFTFQFLLEADISFRGRPFKVDLNDLSFVSSRA